MHLRSPTVGVPALSVQTASGAASPAQQAFDELLNLIFEFAQGAIPPTGNKAAFGSGVGVGRELVFDGGTGFMTWDSEDSVTKVSLKRRSWLRGFGNRYRHEVNAQSANYTATADDELITEDATGAARTVTLPTASTNIGQFIHVKKIDASANTVTVSRAGTDTIENATTVVLAGQWNSATLYARAPGSWAKIATT